MIFIFALIFIFSLHSIIWQMHRWVEIIKCIFNTVCTYVTVFEKLCLKSSVQIYNQTLYSNIKFPVLYQQRFLYLFLHNIFLSNSISSIRLNIIDTFAHLNTDSFVGTGRFNNPYLLLDTIGILDKLVLFVGGATVVYNMEC